VTGPAKTLRFLRDGERITVSDADTDDGDATAR
jgi:hypothetical protein